ncbi:MAG: UrcA family protein [Gammaproteobacteria bacterium]|jgi:UrcA family protein|nr:UrcA family protein [Gammaproteobacteria bacterium]
MKESKLVKGVVATVAVIAFSLPAIASADELAGRSEKVTYSDLNVEKEAGAQSLYRRIQQAAKRVCGVESLKVAGNLRQLSQQQNCYRDALDATVAKIDNAALTELHKG